MSQLNTVMRVEKDREDKAAQAYRIAQQTLTQQRQKLSSLQQYRLDYMRQLQQNGQQGGLDARNYHQHLQFVSKLDKACEQQNQIISQASMVVDQRRQQLVKQQKRRQAVDFLLEKQQLEAQAKAERCEQHQLDEFALQKFIRANNAGFR